MRKKDIEEVRKIIQDEIKEAFVREFTVEKGKRQPGDPEKRFETMKMPVTDFLAHYIPLVEGALRGMQETVDRVKNNVNRNTAQLEQSTRQLEAVGNILIGMEKSAKLLAETSDAIKRLGLPQIQLAEENESAFDRR